MSSAGQPMPPQTAQTPEGAPPPNAPADQTQALLAAVQKGLVDCVQQLSQQLNVPPPVILKAVQAIIARLGAGGPAPGQPQPGAVGVRPTQ